MPDSMTLVLSDAHKERLYALARDDRSMAEMFERGTGRLSSVNDPIDAELYRLRNALYCALATGAEPEAAFQEHYARAAAACERFNAKQGQGDGRTWHPTASGYCAPEAAWQRLRHAIRLYTQLLATPSTPPTIAPDVAQRIARAAVAWSKAHIDMELRSFDDSAVSIVAAYCAAREALLEAVDEVWHDRPAG